MGRWRVRYVRSGKAPVQGVRKNDLQHSVVTVSRLERFEGMTQ